MIGLDSYGQLRTMAQLIVVNTLKKSSGMKAFSLSGIVWAKFILPMIQPAFTKKLCNLWFV